MGWSLGFDRRFNRDIGYGVPAYCDHPHCWAEIDRGLSYACGGEPYGGERGCGLYFCSNHLYFHAFRGEAIYRQVCLRCANHKAPYKITKREHSDWIEHKLNDPSWEEWRKENPEQVAKYAVA